MKKSIIRSTGIIFGLTIIAKTIGFFKSIVQASYYGATIETDAYNIAWGAVGDILYLFTTAIAVAFVPLYIQTKEKNKKDANVFATKSITLFSILSVCFIVVLEITAPFIMKIFAPDYSGEILELTVKCFRILVLGFVFSIMISLYQNLLNAERVYGYSAVSSVINSVVLITFIIVFANTMGVYALVYSVLASFFIQTLILYIKGRKYAGVSMAYGLKDEKIKLLILQAVPVLISQATVEINQAVSRALLTYVAIGAVTSVSYAIILYQFVSSLISLPLSTVMFTELSEAGAKRDLEYIKSELSKLYKIIILICIPIMIVTWFSAYEIVSIIYGHGKFQTDSLEQVAIALGAYMICLIPVTIKSVLSRAFYSLNDTKRPMVIGILEVLVNITLSIILVQYWGVFGVVMATAIASLLFVIVMIIIFNKKYVNTSSNLMLKYWRVIVSTAISLIAVYLSKRMIDLPNIWSFCINTLICFVCYCTTLYILKDRTFLFAVNIVTRRIHKGK